MVHRGSKFFTLFLIVAVLALLATSCRSSKHGTKDDAPVSVVTLPAEATTSSAATLTNDSNFTAKIHASVRLNGENISTSGNLRMRLGEVIQVSLHDPILGIAEVARLEISPEAVLIIDRYNKRYVIMTYDEINAIARQSLDYSTVEYHFWQQALRTDTDELHFTIPTSERGVELTLRLSSKNNSHKWDAHTVPSDKYQQVAPEVLLKQIK